MVRLGYIGALIGCVAATVVPSAPAFADPPDPHQPEMTRNFCPGGQWGFGRLRICDGEKYADGSYWHQWMSDGGWGGPTFHYDCVGDSGNNVMPAPPPPGGCDGAIPPEPPPDAPPPAGEPAPPGTPAPPPPPPG
ncbi:hypothetical protein KIH27_13515 [Mycobacterium sp. M1]|uniref:Secreted protein n=1 Tax=Mycolicibacter acidiphilus TaxID=2835306 RepID=A0ABS5RMA0_9MYCO|nr:hypothetical protein [Mycolicibacter acidiphilus]